MIFGYVILLSGLKAVEWFAKYTVFFCKAIYLVMLWTIKLSLIVTVFGVWSLLLVVWYVCRALYALIYWLFTKRKPFSVFDGSHPRFLVKSCNYIIHGESLS